MKRENEIFRLLGDPTRRAVFEQLTRGEASVRELTAAIRKTQPAISQHLAELRKAGLVAHRREGRSSFYRVEPSGLRPLVDWLERYQEFWIGRLKRLKDLLQEMDE